MADGDADNVVFGRVVAGWFPENILPNTLFTHLVDRAVFQCPDQIRQDSTQTWSGCKGLALKQLL